MQNGLLKHQKQHHHSLATLPDDHNEQPHNNVPVLRRRKYTKQQRKSLVIEPETSLILAGVGLQGTSSSDDDTRVQINGNTLPSTDRRHKYGARRKMKKRFFSTSNLIKSGNEENLEHTFSTTASNIGGTNKSLSVRDLNGDNIDFNNRDSVKKWTSQIFAELESLPSSRRQSMDVSMQNLQRSGILSPPEVIINDNTSLKSMESYEKPPEPAPRLHTLRATEVGPNFLRDLLSSSYHQYPESSICSERMDTTQKPSRTSSFEWLNNGECSSDEADREVALIGMSKNSDIEKRKKNYEDLEKSVHELEVLGSASWFPPPPPIPKDEDSDYAMGEYSTLPTTFRKRHTKPAPQRNAIGSVYENAFDGKKSILQKSLRSAGNAGNSSGASKPFSLENLPMVQRLSEFNGKTEEDKTKNNNFSDFALQLAERDAADACTWLRKAGFSKYADQFDEGKLPLKVTDESGILEADLRSLNRRISILNRCHAMKVDSVPMRRRMNNDFPRVVDQMSDSDNVSSGYADSRRYGNYSNTWHRPTASDYAYTGSLARNTHLQKPKSTWHSQVAETSHPMDAPQNRKVHRTDWYEAQGSRRERNDNPDAGSSSEAAAKLQRSQSERIKDRARAIMKKMDLRGNSKRPKESRSRPAPIGDPVLVSYDTPKNSIRSHHIDRPSILPERGRQLYPTAPFQARSKSIAQNRRGGLVFITPTSPDSPDFGFSDTNSSIISTSRSQNVSDRRRELSMPPPSRHRINVHQNPYDGTLKRREIMPVDSYLFYAGERYPEKPPEDPKMTPEMPRKQPPEPNNMSMFNDGYYTHEIKTAPPRQSVPINNINNNNNNLLLQLKDLKDLKDLTDEPKLTRRSDSGLGSSLSRSPSGPHTQRIRESQLPYPGVSGSWREPEKGAESSYSNLDGLSVIEIQKLRRDAFEKLTKILDRYQDHPQNHHHKNLDPDLEMAPKQVWSVHRLIKKMKMSDKKDLIEESSIFGVSLDTVYHRTGYFLPRPILEIMQFLKSMSSDTVGIFRKNGVKSRIAELRGIIDNHSKNDNSDIFVGEFSLDATQVHDVADLLKQYLRDLPEPLMTVKMSEVFANICSLVPDIDRFTALQYAILLLPDENREALKTLLLFLKKVSRSSQVNNMTAQNLSVCFTPSLFQLGASRLDKISAGSRRHKTVGATGLPSEKEMKEARACQLCLTMLIEYAQTVFMLPDCVDESSTDADDDQPVLSELGLRGPRSFLVDRVIDMIRDHSDTWKTWQPEGSYRSLEISSKKAADSHPLKTFRVWIDIPAAPKSVMLRILKERFQWDTSIINWRHVEYVSAPDTDIHQYVLNETIGHPTKDCHVARFHSAGLTEIRGACAIAERSVKCAEDQMLGGVAATVFDQRFLIEPIGGGQSRVNYLARVDLKGRSLQWYNKSFGTIMCRQMDRLRESFQSNLDKGGPETNV